MDANLINPFTDAALNVLDTMASTRAQAGKPYIKKDKVARGDVTGVIGRTGEARGTISVSFSKKSILSIVSNMFGEEIKELNEEINDAAGEITNVISGQARKKLDEQGMSLKAAIPSVIMGKNHTISHINKNPIIAIPFTTNSGQFIIEVCLEE